MKSYGVAIQMKATEQYVPVVLFIMLYMVVLTFESCAWNPKMWKLTDKYFPGVWTDQRGGWSVNIKI